uniref:Rho guanine nucleotide exchange factor (GEF) 12b n=1 Tax=Mola mola TaxID=94237 RepID=A0A3Q4BI26_MOLML
KDPTDKKDKNEKSPVSLKHEFDPTGLVQRCVIIQRDENGFGLTVSGDNPVFVQLVKENGAAMRAGVQTGDRIIKVSLISGSYVALTVLGRPPGLPHIPLEEEEEEGEDEENEKKEEEKEEGVEVRSASCLLVPHSPALPSGQRCSPEPSSPQEHTSTCPPNGDRATGLRNEEAEDEDGGPRLSEQTPSSLGDSGNDRTSTNNHSMHGNPLPETPAKRDTPSQSPDICVCPSPDSEDTSDAVIQSYNGDTCEFIIGAEDDYFDSQQEQINGECSSFQNMDLLKSRPAHLAVFLHHVVSQFDPAPLLCYLYADMHKHTSSKESRRFFMEFHSLFLDRTAVLTESYVDCLCLCTEKRRLELLPEELCKQYTQALQDTLLPDLHRNLEDFRQKRSMGLTLAEDELSKLDTEPGKEALDKECSCAEHILSKIEDILVTSQPTEEEKCQTMQYVILTYMKHLGVKVKEPRGLEHKRARINFLPKIKKSIKPEREGEEKVKKPRFPNILGPPRRLSRPLEQNHLVVTSSALTDVSPLRVQPRPSDTPQPGEPQDGVCSAAGTQFDFSPSNLEQPQEEDQDSFRMECAVTSADIQSEDDQGGEMCEEDLQNWQSLVSHEVLASLTPQEIKRQEVINELFYTERAHLRTLKVLDCVFYQRLSRDAILPPEDIKHIFINLEEIIQLHVSVTDQMTTIRKRNETSVIGPIADDLLAWFGGEEEEKIKRAVGTFCSNQPSALELIKSRQKKDQRFSLFMQVTESNRLCRRLQLKDIIPMEMQRFTKYPLLLDNIAKNTVDGEEKEKVKRAGECCKEILNHVNQSVKEAENKQRLEEYQRRLDISSLKQSENPMILELKNLDLTKRKMVHEGPLSWKVNKDKTTELYTILLEDILVLLQKQDERLVLKFHGKNPTSAADTKHVFSPVIKLNTVLARPVATDNKSFFVLSMSENGAQIYELTAQTVSDQKTWQCLITQHADAMKAKPDNREAAPNLNPFDGLKSEDEDEEPAVADSQEEEEEEEENVEVDEAELEAFLDRQLADGLPLQQDGLRFPGDNQEHDTFSVPSSKSEEALRTRKSVQLCRTVWVVGLLLSALYQISKTDCSEESSTDDDGGDVGIDMRRLLSSSSQAGGSRGPDLSRQLMTHLRLLQADLQYLKEVELKYNELQQMHVGGGVGGGGALAADPEDNSGTFPPSLRKND